MTFNNMIYDQIKSGNFDQGKIGNIRQFHVNLWNADDLSISVLRVGLRYGS